MRLHNAFLTLEEIEALMKHLVSQPKPDEYKIAGVREFITEENLTGPLSGSRDDLFKEAVRLVILHQQGSISLLQRRLKIGYSRAARLIDEMELNNVIQEAIKQSQKTKYVFRLGAVIFVSVLLLSI